MTANKRVLISGAGITGLTLAWWLHEYGFEPSIVEKRPDLSDEGYMIDFYGSGFDVAEKMGLVDELRARHYDIPELVYVDSKGEPKARLQVDKFREALDYRHFNFMRGDLESVLHNAVRGVVPIQFGTSITEIFADSDRLRVALTDGTERECDLVVGADGIHSNVRRLVWGDESRFDRYLGFYVACAVVENFLHRDDAFFGHLEPGTHAAVYSIREDRLATFLAFKSEEPLDARTRDEKHAVLEQKFAGQGWIVPEILEAMREADHLFFDSVTQIQMESWHRGRVALAGDACQCLTLLAGQGASMGMAGAYVLAKELNAAEGDYQTAFAAYQARLLPEIRERQKSARGLAGRFVPDSWFAIWLTKLFVTLAFLPGFRWIFRREVGAGSIIK